MPTRRSSGHVALVAAIALVVSPGFIHGQNVAIDRALFLVSTKGPDGKWTVRETDRVPLRPRDACYAWRLHVSNALGELAWRAEFTLPGQPGTDPTLLVTKRSEKPQDGWVGDSWCVTKGDPVGEHVIRVYVQDSLARAFTFFVVAPEDLVGQDPARGGVVHEGPSVDPLGMLGDFSTQRPSLEEELWATYPKPPNRLDMDPAMSSVLLMDIDLKGALGQSRVKGAALVTGGNELIRAAPMKGDLVMFQPPEPGTYSLRFIKVDVYMGGDLQPRETLVLQKPASLEINVTVVRGAIHYVGTVVVKGKVGVFGSKPPEFQLTYDAKRELEAWSAFKKKYEGSPWTALADRRILALRSPERAQDDAIAVAAPDDQDPTRGDVMSGVAKGDPLTQLAGEWGLTVFVMGAGQFGGPNCGKSDRPGPPSVNIASPSDGAVSLAAACDDGSEYSFRLRHDSATQAYVLTVNSAPGISVQDFPVAYVDGKGWQGKRDQPVDGETQSITAMVAPIEGRSWNGWMIAVLPTADIGRSDLPEKPYFRADLIRRK